MIMTYTECLVLTKFRVVNGVLFDHLSIDYDYVIKVKICTYS
jgi:hypothetical protein